MTRERPLQPPPGCNEKWEDMNLADFFVNYVKARVEEETLEVQVCRVSNIFVTFCYV